MGLIMRPKIMNFNGVTMSFLIILFTLFGFKCFLTPPFFKKGGYNKKWECQISMAPWVFFNKGIL
jgi:hypothetical protein